ncbi:hypothetical protein OFN18_27665, partial [Escherichia coli]|nr:hypothetical protein [Escherichia coli]
VLDMPDAVLQEISHAVTWWMEEASKTILCHEEILRALCRRVLMIETSPESSTIRNGIETYDPVSTAINHPIGHVTQSLITLWFKQNPNDNDLLPVELKTLFTKLC